MKQSCRRFCPWWPKKQLREPEARMEQQVIKNMFLVSQLVAAMMAKQTQPKNQGPQLLELNEQIKRQHSQWTTRE